MLPYYLGLGDIEAVLERYDRDLAPSVLQGIRSLVDGASLLRRLDLMGIPDRAGDIAEMRSMAGRFRSTACRSPGRVRMRQGCSGG